MDQLREQLISTFREQMDVRRHLMELENNYMELQIESSRHLLTIAEYADSREQIGHIPSTSVVQFTVFHQLILRA